MYLFKTSGETFDNVIKHQKHAFVGVPQSWRPGELILVSKNKNARRTLSDGRLEKGIQFTMRFVNVRLLRAGEADLYWPGNEGRWQYLVECEDTKMLNQPFDLDDLSGCGAGVCRYVQNFRQFELGEERVIEEYLRKTGFL